MFYLPFGVSRILRLTEFSVVAAGIYRTILLNRVFNESYETTWVVWEMWIWTLLELYIVIAAASMPALKPFYVRYIDTPVRTALSSYARSRASQGKKSTQISSSQAFSSLVSSQRRSGYQDVDSVHPGKRDHELRVVSLDGDTQDLTEKSFRGITRETAVQVDSDPREENWTIHSPHFQPRFSSVRESEETARQSNNENEEELNLPKHGAKVGDSIV